MFNGKVSILVYDVYVQKVQGNGQSQGSDGELQQGLQQKVQGDGESQGSDEESSQGHVQVKNSIKECEFNEEGFPFISYYKALQRLEQQDCVFFYEECCFQGNFQQMCDYIDYEFELDKNEIKSIYVPEGKQIYVNFGDTVQTVLTTKCLK